MEGDLLNLIIGENLCKETKGALVWNGAHNGVFSVKFAYLNMCIQYNGISNDVFSLLWEAKAMPKTLFTAWRILLGRLSTFDNLIRRGLIVTSSLCVLCNATEESSQHLFMECVYTQRVWSLGLRWIAILSVQHNIVHFESFQLPHFTAKQNQVWKGIWVTIVWCIWDQRNLDVFKQGVVDADEIFHSAQLLAWLRLKHGASPFGYAFSD